MNGLQSEPEVIHTYPLNDIREHELNGTDCDCQPKVVQIGERGVVVVHNSYDGRELYEQNPWVS